MQLKLELASKNIHKENLKNFLKITVDVSDEKRKLKTGTKPVFLIPVIDRSGSMSSAASRNNRNVMPIYHQTTLNFSTSVIRSTSSSDFYSKLDCAKNATCELLDLLEDGDKLAIVSFDDSITVEQKPIVINEGARKEIKNNIDKIYAGGCTNISDALITAHRLFSKADMEKYNCKIVLLSDGCANVGFSKEEQFIPLMTEILNHNISTSTIGLGDDYDLGVMDTISSNCAGSFHHISDANAIKDIFVSELRKTQAIVCQNAVLDVLLPDMVAFKPNFNNYTENIQKDKITIQLGNLYSNKAIYYEFSLLDDSIKEVIVGAKLTYGDDASNGDFISVSKKVLVVDNKNDIVENEAIIDEFVSIVKDKYVYDAAKSISCNDMAWAAQSYASSVSTMDSLVTAYNCCDSSSLEDMKSISASISSTSMTQDSLRNTFSTVSKKLRNS